MTLLVQGDSYSLYTCHSIHTWPYFTRSIVLLLALVSYLSVYTAVRFIIHWFQYSNYIPFTFIFLYYCFLFSCVHLLVCFWRTFIFSVRARGDWRATVRRNPGRLPGMSPTFLVLVFWHFVLLWCPDAKIVSFFISTLLCFESYIQTRTIVDVCLLCEIKLLVIFCTCVQEFGFFAIA